MKKEIVSVLLPAAALLALNAGPLWGQSQSGPDKSSRGTSQSAKSAEQSSKDTSVGGTQSKRAGDANAPGAPNSGSASRESQASGMGGQQDIREAQQALKAQGHDPGPIDGVMGPKTQQALREFQSSNGLQQTGRLDEETMEKLNIEDSSTKGSGSMERGDSSTRQGSSPMGK